uniref:Enoyl-[acyl-carrier-protein] reductase, mitochondrial n=1 Tax=Trichuris muris TaxID=70415 RepID=A0A5S6Q8Y7_TRIMR
MALCVFTRRLSLKAHRAYEQFATRFEQKRTHPKTVPLSNVIRNPHEEVRLVLSAPKCRLAPCFRMHVKLLGSFIRPRVSLFRTIVAQQLEYTERGDPPTVVKLTNHVLSSVRPDEVRYKIMAATINPADINTIQGIYPIQPPLPAVGGMEGVMRIEEVGSDVWDIAVGDWAIPLPAGFGTWRTDGIAPRSDVIKISNKLSIVQAATLAVNPSTAYRMLKDFVDLTPGDVVLQNGANSAVGQLVIQLCRHLNVSTVNLIRDGKADEKETKDYLGELGADVVLTETEFKRKARSLFEKLAAPKLALNCVSGRGIVYMAGCLAPKGKLVTYGGMSKQPLYVSTGAFIFKEIQLHGFWMTSWNRDTANQVKRRKMLDDLTDLSLSGKLKPVKYQLVPFKEYQDALAATTAGHGRKKILVFEWCG